ncbi:MAG: hypothetical protein ABS64_01945 [Microbacterium sp. SCN 69-37]|nr:MAG: hypothetical protein ABS64_01945 [Microbacterium sp. SCN 69-37]
MHERTVDQVVDRRLAEAERCRDLPEVAGGDAVGKDGQSEQCIAFRFVEQAPAPVDDGAQRLMTRLRRARSSVQERESIREAILDLGDRQHPRLRSGQLER